MNMLRRKIPVLILMLVFVLSLMLMIPGMLLAQEDEEAEAEEEVVIPDPDPEVLEFDITYPEIQAELGEIFEFQFTVDYDIGDEPFGLEEDVSEKTFDILVEFPENWFAATTPQYQKEVESGEVVRVGLNKFQTEQEHVGWPAFRGNPEEEEKQKVRLKELRNRRDNRAVMQSLKDLKEEARKDSNMVVPLINCVKQYTTIGEILDTLREVWGEFHAKQQVLR